MKKILYIALFVVAVLPLCAEEEITITHFIQNLTGSLAGDQNKEESLEYLKTRIFYNMEKIQEIILEELEADLTPKEFSRLFYYQTGALLTPELYMKLKFLEENKHRFSHKEKVIYEIKGYLEYSFFLFILHNKIKNSQLREY